MTITLFNNLLRIQQLEPKQIFKKAETVYLWQTNLSQDD